MWFRKLSRVHFEGEQFLWVHVIKGAQLGKLEQQLGESGGPVLAVVLHHQVSQGPDQFVLQGLHGVQVLDPWAIWAQNKKEEKVSTGDQLVLNISSECVFSVLLNIITLSILKCHLCDTSCSSWTVLTGWDEHHSSEEAHFLRVQPQRHQLLAELAHGVEQLASAERPQRVKAVTLATKEGHRPLHHVEQRGEPDHQHLVVERGRVFRLMVWYVPDGLNLVYILTFKSFTDVLNVLRGVLPVKTVSQRNFHLSKVVASGAGHEWATFVPHW